MASYDLIIIGGGPAGYTGAIRAAALGLNTAVVEKQKNLGGTCLNVGCIPSKALLASSEHYHYAKHRFEIHGITVKDIAIDVPAMMKRKDGVVDSLAKGIDFLFKKNKIERMPGSGKVLGTGRVEVTDAEGKTSTHEAKHILIATGSTPIDLPFLPVDGDRVITSDHAITLSSAPKSLLIVGAGAIGLELGSVWARLGTEITVVEFPAHHRRFRQRSLRRPAKTLRKTRFHLPPQHQSPVGQGRQRLR